jgi:hypothetical protein
MCPEIDTNLTFFWPYIIMYHNNVTNKILVYTFTITNTLLCRNSLHVSGVKRPSSGLRHNKVIVKVKVYQVGYVIVIDTNVRQTCGFALREGKGKGKKVKQSHYRVPGGWGSQISRQSAHEGGKVVSPTHRQPLPPANVPFTHFC